MTDKEKSLGIVAELAFCKHLTPDEAARLPEVLPHERYRKAWQAAADAVAAEGVKRAKQKEAERKYGQGLEDSRLFGDKP